MHRLTVGMLVSLFFIASGTSALYTPTHDWKTYMVSLTLSYFAYHSARRSQSVNTNEPKEIFDYYMYMWKLFYGCYFLLPLLRSPNRA